MDENKETAKPATKALALTLQQILDRCVEEGECLLWTGKTKGGQPVTDGTGRLCVRPMAYRLSTGKEIPPGHRTFMSCRNKLCMQRAHFRCGPPSAYIAAATKDGAYKGHTHQIAWMRRAQAAAPPDKVRVIRAALGAGKSVLAVARETKVPRRYVSLIKNNEWRETLPGASVFNQ
jgi:hypothetical protein